MPDDMEDAEFIRLFSDQFPPVEDPPPLGKYASPGRYDRLFMGDNLDGFLDTLSCDGGELAWGLAPRMQSLNDMYAVTGNSKYLAANLKCTRLVLGYRDDRVGKSLWTGKVVPAWGSDRYAERGRSVFAVHTGLIVAAILDFLILARSNPGFADFLGDEIETILGEVQEALGVHDPQWRDGPGEKEGHYVGLDQENVCEGRPLPGNRLSAMGWALWSCWRATGSAQHRGRALAIGTYIKNRLVPSPDGAFYWTYWLPEEGVKGGAPREPLPGEDTSHAGLTATLPLILGLVGEVFTNDDLRRFAMTVRHGFGRLGRGILLGRVTGQPDPELIQYIGRPSSWLPLSVIDPAVSATIIDYYLGRKPVPGARELSQLLRYT